jgi:hypothetical protein
MCTRINYSMQGLSQVGPLLDRGMLLASITSVDPLSHPDYKAIEV